MAATKNSKSTKERKYSEAASKTISSALHRAKRGTLKSGPAGHGGTVKSREQAIAIGLSEAREKGQKVPPRKTTAKKKASKKK
ncbi:DUF6496 domain-containing protein [Hydrocarboniphaga effusa]|uniref:DUF6496 domain-containing protein n=1 Tax=Hydrocarboniphaga effusa TaxID=243629 RepID=UPI0035AFA30F